MAHHQHKLLALLLIDECGRVSSPLPAGVQTANRNNPPPTSRSGFFLFVYILLTSICSALREVQKILKRFSDPVAEGDAMFKKTISLALMDIAFRLPQTKRNAQNKGFTPRVLHLAMFLSKYYDRISTFDDIRQYVEELSFKDAKTLVEEVFPEVLKDVSDISLA